MMTHLRYTISALALLLAVALPAETYTPQEVPNPKAEGQECYVSNPDAILADSTVAWLNGCAADLDRKTRVEMAIVALESIGEEDPFDFAYELFQRWGIGGEGRNTGVLMLFVLESHDMRIMTGTGIESVLTDAKCSQIMHDEMFPAFKEGDYDRGLCLGALAVYEVCTDGETLEELLAIRSVTNRGRYGEEEDEWSIGEEIALWSMLVFAVLIAIGIYFSTIKKCPVCHKRKAHAVRRHTLIAATYAHAGKAEVTYLCKHCGHEFVRNEVIPKLVKSSGSASGGGWSSGGGGGSWGGGSTSGGGAGGKW